MRPLRALAVAPVLFALFAGSAAAAGTSAGLDPSFGNGGRITAAVAGARYGAASVQGMALSPDGRTYVLAHSVVLAFEADGQPAAGFGKGGRVKVEPAGAEGVTGLAVDSQGLVSVVDSNNHRVQRFRF